MFWNQGEVLEARPTLRKSPRDELVPALTRARFDDPGVCVLCHEAHAAHLDLQHELRHVARENDVAAAAQHELRRAPELGVVDDLAHIGIRRHAHQRARHRRQPEGVVRFEADPRFDLHATIFA